MVREAEANAPRTHKRKRGDRGPQPGPTRSCTRPSARWRARRQAGRGRPQGDRGGPRGGARGAQGRATSSGSSGPRRPDQGLAQAGRGHVPRGAVQGGRRPADRPARGRRAPGGRPQGGRGGGRRVQGPRREEVRPMRRDYYAVLGIAATAAPREIRQAYRRLARQYSPGRQLLGREAAGALRGDRRGVSGAQRPGRAGHVRPHRDSAPTRRSRGAPRGDDLHASVELRVRRRRAGRALGSTCSASRRARPVVAAGRAPGPAPCAAVRSRRAPRGRARASSFPRASTRVRRFASPARARGPVRRPARATSS